MTTLIPTLIAIVLLAGVAAADDEPGAAMYKAHCASCHGETGKADTALGRALKVAPIVADRALAAMTPAEIARTLRENPKHRGVVDLTDEQIDEGAVFIRRLAGTP